jgi:iron complex transport system substrate-binding protein
MVASDDCRRRRPPCGPWWVALLGVLTFAAPARSSEPAARLVSLAPSLTEIAFALGVGDRLVGRSSACDFPDAATNLPVAGDFGRPNLEPLLALKPDAVLVTSVENPLALDGLRRRGIRVLVLPCESWSALLDAARAIADAAGKPEAAAAWIAQMNGRRRRLEDRAAETLKTRARPRIFVEIWADPLTTAGGASFVNDLVALAGGTNVAAGRAETYAVVGREWLAGAKPEVVVVGHRGAAARAAADYGPARIIDDIPPDLLLRAGPRIIEGAEELAKRLWEEKNRNSNLEIRNKSEIRNSSAE